MSCIDFTKPFQRKPCYLTLQWGGFSSLTHATVSQKDFQCLQSAMMCVFHVFQGTDFISYLLI
jgi:hypothetical protein